MPLGRFAFLAVMENLPGMVRKDTGDRTQAAIEFEGSRDWAESEPGGGTNVCFTLPQR